MVLRTDVLPEELTEDQRIIFERVMQNFSDGLTRDRGQLFQSGERQRRPRPAQDIDGFTDLVERVIEEQQNAEEVPDKLRVHFLQDFPPTEMEAEVITFGLIRRIPASLSQGQHFNQGVREVKPHVRSIEHDPARPGYSVVTLGQKFENEIVLTCWARTNKAANRRARWLEDTLRKWTWYIRFEGIEDFYFMGQDEDVGINFESTNQMLTGRPLRYYVRTERLTNVLEPEIRQIIVKYGLTTDE